MRTLTTTRELYQFAELDDDAKERARDWWRNLEAQDYEPDYVVDDAERMGAILGIEFDPRPVRLMNGGTRYDPTVYWSGFSSQGDAIRKEAPLDKALHDIADALQAAQRKCFYRLEARTRHRGHYYHSGCMQVDVFDCGNQYANLPDGTEDAISQALRDFADWIYRQLEADYEWRLADEQVDESIAANEYEFDKEGRRA